LIGDGVTPSNEWRGYVLRKIMRRAMRHGKKLGFTDPTLHTLVPVLVGEMSEAYPALVSRQHDIVRMVRSEEERFDAVLTAGLPRLEEALDRAESTGRVMPGDEAFRLYDSLGVPLDFMEDLASQRHLAIDREGFERAMGSQRERARAGSTFRGGEKGLTIAIPAEYEDRFTQAADEFTGYESTRLTGVPILGVFDETGAWVSELGQGRTGYIALPRTPFYIEAGGQVSDEGRLFVEGAEATVKRMVRYAPGRPRLHMVEVTEGSFRSDQLVSAEVQQETRDATRRNHTATHLLHASLRQVLGDHVKQAGSLVAPDRLRFDFVHLAPMSPDQVLEVERLVNQQIRLNTPVQTEVRSTEEAIAAGAMALFGEKYGDRVRVVSVGGFSLELCGGTHVRATGDIGLFTVTEESGVAAGVRRIEALTGAGAVEKAQQHRRALQSVLSALSATPEQAVETVQRLQAEAKRLGREVEQLKMKIALGAGAGSTSGDAGGDVQEIAGVKLVARRVEGLEKAALRGLADSLRDRLGSGVVVLASDNDGKVALVVAVTKDVTTRVQAGRLVKELAPLIGGSGGGRPDFAEAGGKDPAGIGNLLVRAPDVLKSQLQN
jgi:alanyl-tRNA synthetase